jgi:dTDP-4-dehydrorhamnose reductase
MRVLVTGGNGQLGLDLVAHCEASGDQVVTTDEEQLDVTDRDAVHAAVLGMAPDVVFHCAAWTAVDACEADTSRAFAVNAFGVRNVAEAAGRADAHLVHLSTDYVFDGTKPDPYVEWDATNPLSVYGRSKLGGEHEVRAISPTATVVRTSWLCGAGGENMVTTVLRLLADDPARELSFVDDQRGCPSFTADLASVLRRLAARRLPGTFHVTNEGPTTWYRFVQAITVAAGGSADQVRPIATAELQPPRAAPRPANSVLDNLGLRLAGEPSLAPWQEPLERLVKELGAR